MAKRDTETLRYLLDYCEGDRQREKVAAYIQYGTHKRAAEALNCHQRNIERAVQRSRARAVMMTPHPPLGQPARDGEFIKGTSTYYNRDGQPVGQWVKTSIDEQRRADFLRSMCEAMADELPRLAPIPAPKVKAPDLLNLITMTDCHVGMHAWAKEGGADWDLAIAERTLVSASIAMMDKAPAADTCVIAELGDWNHYDGHIAKTPMHQHPLDAAGRPGQMIEASIRILRRIVDAALQRHRKVVLLVAQGNHDLQTYKWLRSVMAAAYEREKRLEIIHEESPFYAYQHGSVMLAWHHGHTAANEALPLLFASKYPQMWGGTEYRVAHTGHRHHKHVKEHPGMTVYQHSTIAAPDNHASSNGYMSHRQAEVLTYHKDFGFVSGQVITPKMLRAA